MATIACPTCLGTGWVKIACCEWCKSYDVAICAECDGEGTWTYDDNYVPSNGMLWSIDFSFPPVSARRGGYWFARVSEAPKPKEYPPLEDRIDLWGDV